MSELGEAMVSLAEAEHDDNPYNVPTINTVCRQRECGCKVGLQSDVTPMPKRVSQHAGSIANPWIVIPCEAHR